MSVRRPIWVNIDTNVRNSVIFSLVNGIDSPSSFNAEEHISSSISHAPLQNSVIRPFAL